MALKFLNKKGWHTGSLRNIENVWKAEQKAENEKRKLEELQKQIREEQDQYEFRKLQEQAGLVPKQERLDFLYESGLGVGKPSNDEYLMGKPLEESKSDDVLQQVAAAPGSLFVEEKISANDQWRKIRSDPLLLIKQQELAAREKIKNNPLRMEAIRKEVELQKKMKQEKKEARKEEKRRVKAEEKWKRKELKKEKLEEGESPENDKGEESRKRGRHEDSPVSDDKDRRGNEARDEDIKRERIRRHDSPGSDDEADRRARDESSRDKKPRREYGEDSRDDRRRRHDSPVSDEDDRRDRKRSRYGEESSSRHRSREEYDRNRRRSPVRSERSPRRSPDRSVRSPRRSRSERRSPIRSERSPRRSPVRSERSPARRSPDRAPRSSGKPPLPKKKVQLTDEEKAARLREMQLDAEFHEEQRWTRIKKASITDAIQEEKDSVKSSKNFLNEASRSLYGAEDDGKASIADTLHRRSHYREKFTDTNAFRKS